MASQAPRSDTSKKREQLLQRQRELEYALRSEIPTHKLLKAAERVRAAQLSLFKAQLHWALESRLLWLQRHLGSNRDYGDCEQIEKAMRAWTSKPGEEIIAECKKCRSKC